MRIFLIGGSESLGRSVLAALLRMGYRVYTLEQWWGVRRLPRHANLFVYVGHPDRLKWREIAASCDVVLHLSGANPRWTVGGGVDGIPPLARLLDALRAARRGPKRIIYLSSLGAAPDSPYPRQRLDWAAEELVRQSEIEYLILRPGWIYDPRSTGSLLTRLWGRLPVCGTPTSRIQPVALANVVEGILKGVRVPLEASRTYEIGGPRVYRLQEVLLYLTGAQRSRSLRPLYLTPESTLLRRLPLSAQIVPPWAVGRLCNPIEYFRDLCIRPILLDSTDVTKEWRYPPRTVG